MKNKSLVVFAVAVAVSSSAFAITGSITKTARPGNIYGTAPAYSLAQFPINSLDFPSGTLNKTKTLVSVQYTWYHYTNGTTDKVELCYDRPYNATLQYCTDVTAAQSGTSTAFNLITFDAGSKFYLRHTISGSASPKTPSLTSDQVVVTYSYN